MNTKKKLARTMMTQKDIKKHTGPFLTDNWAKRKEARATKVANKTAMAQKRKLNK